MKIAVSGAGGFIGRHVLRELGTRPVESIALIHSRHSRSGIPTGTKVVPLDLHEPPEQVFETIGKPDVLIHLAWAGLPNYKSLHHFEEELPAQYHFLQSLIKAGLKSLVVTGTCFEYGMQSGALDESMVPQPSNPYGYAKDALRRQLGYLRAVVPFRLTWARLFYLHGDGQAASSLWPQLQKAAERGDAAFNMSGGEQLRDYLPVAEAARSLVSLAVADKNPGAVNVCAGIPISVRRLVESWIDENGWLIRPNFGHYPYPDYEPMAFWGNRRKLDNLLQEK